MNVWSRGVRNAFRNGIRTLSIMIILSLSIGLALTMLLARQAVQAKIDSVKSVIGNTITVSPAGANGFEGGGEPLMTDQLAKVKALPHVVGVIESLTDRLASGDTNLQSAIDAGTLGRRQARVFSGDRNGENFTPPIVAAGSNDLTSLQGLGNVAPQVTSGKAFDPNQDQNVALVGQALATKNNLSVGSTFQAYNTTLTVAGIFDASGNKFATSALVLPLPTLQRLSGQANDITAATVHVDSITNLAATTDAIKNSLGSAADVTNQQDTSSQALAPLENIKNISLFSLGGSVIAGAVIILLTMLMIVRERRREIGVAKAIGAGNSTIMFQFMIEAVTFTMLGAIGGTMLGLIASNPIAELLVSSSASSPTQPRFGGGGFARIISQGGVDVHTLQVAIGWQIVAYGLLAAIVIALAGSAVPARLIANIRPAEVMRAE